MGSTFSGSVASGGSITKAEIVRIVLIRLQGIIVTDMDVELLDTLYDIANRGNFLETTGSITTADGTAGYTEPTNLKEVKDVHVAGDNHITLGSYSDYLRFIEGFDTPTTGEPVKYCRHNGEMFFYDPLPGDAYTVTVDYWKFHSGSLDDFEFDKRFRESIICGTLARLWGGQLSRRDGAINEVQLQKGLCSEQVLRLLSTTPRPIRRVKYNDI